MGLSIFIAVIGFVLLIISLIAPFKQPIKRLMRVASTSLWIVAGLTFGITGFTLNQPGKCLHFTTIFGNEDGKCTVGWTFTGWGKSSEWNHLITITHTNDSNAAGSSVNEPFEVRMADNWAGRVTQTTRFAIPLERESFLRLAREFRSPERLISTTLLPAVTASLDSTSNLYSMEQYYLGARSDYKTDFRNAVVLGRPKVNRTLKEKTPTNVNNRAAANDSEEAADTSQVGDSRQNEFITTKVIDTNGNVVREPHDHVRYEITAQSAIVAHLDPDDEFERQISERKEAAARRTIAREKRLEQDEQRLLTIAEGETKIAKRQAESKVEQIQKTTEAETTKKLALISADQERSKARIAKETAEILLERSKIDAEAVKVKADADAYEKRELLEADGALQAKLDAYVRVNDHWAQAFSQRKVPTTVFGASGEGTGSDSDVQTFMNIMTMNAAKELQLDRNIGSGVAQAQ